MFRNTVPRLRTAWGAVLTGLGDDERGDVPGWVLITLMTAGLAVVARRGFTTVSASA